MPTNDGKHFRTERLDALAKKAARRRLDAVLVRGEANQKSLIGFGCDNGLLAILLDRATYTVFFYTDFRYIPAAKRMCPELAVRDLDKLDLPLRGTVRIGYEADISARIYLRMRRDYRKAILVDVSQDLLWLRAVKTPAEIAGVAAAEALNDRIWAAAQAEFRPGMTEKHLQRIVRAYMNALGEGEAFETIVCAGANAAECHHVPDDTVWCEGEPLLVDMGVKLEGWCSDMTRCLRSGNRRYAEIYSIVLAAQQAAIAACRPGITGKELDKVARRVIRKAGYGKYFGHALGHGVGLEIHEWPVASKKSATVLRPGMIVTIEPGIYIPGECGVRIEDLVLITRDGCENLTHSEK